MPSFIHRITRTKRLEGDIMRTELKRCLSTMDLILVGISSMVGSGIYVLAGEIAREVTGPAVVLSFLVAGFASGLSAWCYAEFGSRVPSAGSAYVYTYLTIGELAAFVIGWNMILEQMIGVAAVTRGLVGYINDLTNGDMWHFSGETLHLGQVDPFGPMIIGLLTLLVCSGAKESLTVNNVMAVGNLGIIVAVTIAGFILAEPSNWSNFMPYGYSSVFQGAAQAYFAYIGYDVVAISSEEARDPAFSVPFALATDVFCVGSLYCLNAAALTLMVPYEEINVSAAFASAFTYRDLSWARYVICVGAIAAMVCSALAQVFTLPRCIYAMASDGLIYRFLSRVSSRTHVPLYATFIGSLSISAFAAIFTINELAEFLSIGTLMAYIIVAIAVIVLRYLPQDPINDSKSVSESTALLTSIRNNSLKLQQVVLLGLFVAFTIVLNIVLTIPRCIGLTAYLVIVCLLAVSAICCLVVLRVTSVDNGGSYTCRVPWVPFLPGLSVFVNIYLMCHLTTWTWIRFGIWMALGAIIYFTYGIRNSRAHPQTSSSDNYVSSYDEPQLS